LIGSYKEYGTLRGILEPGIINPQITQTDLPPRAEGFEIVPGGGEGGRCPFNKCMAFQVEVITCIERGGSRLDELFDVGPINFCAMVGIYLARDD
jgi:hypothetical protein